VIRPKLILAKSATSLWSLGELMRERRIFDQEVHFCSAAAIHLDDGAVDPLFPHFIKAFVKIP
jgi:hypothetical protein